MMKVFIDTNVLLDVLAGRVPFYDDAAAIVTLAEKRVVEVCVSAISFATVAYVLRKSLDTVAVRAALRGMRDAFSIVACDGNILSHAIDSGIVDYEDAIQYHSARETGVDYLVTRNARDFPRDSLFPIVSPSEFLGLLEERNEM